MRIYITSIQSDLPQSYIRKIANMYMEMGNHVHVSRHRVPIGVEVKKARQANYDLIVGIDRSSVNGGDVHVLVMPHDPLFLNWKAHSLEDVGKDTFWMETRL